MRLRFGAVLCLFLAFWGSGCRKALAPTTLDNQAPETWIVAAPQDTITTRDPFNTPIKPQIGKIPVRFHMYWAGSDRDGMVAGYYWAVVETLPVPPEGSSSVPALPGPKARDYHYTTATDSIFIFSASEEVSERQHAFYIYAVDNKGRPDPTPARFVFSAYDRFPPQAVIDEFRADGTEYILLPPDVNGKRDVMAVNKTYFVHDFYEISNSHPFPRDTVMSNALLHARWHGVPTIPSTVVTGYRYKLDEPNFNTVDSSVHQTGYNTGVGTDRVNPGPKIFTLRAIGQSGWRGEATRWFQMNFAPDTWFSGPDPTGPGWTPQPMPYAGLYRDFAATGWQDNSQPPVPFYTVPGSMLSPDSLTQLPAVRPQRKTFFEIYNDKMWLRQEDDTVHMNSWVIIPAGGFDKDSPYSVKVNTALLDSILRVQHLPVITPDKPNGSPIGFRIKVQVKDASGRLTQPSETTTYPVYDPASVFHQPVINGYQGLNTAGRAYALIVAEDGDGTVDRRVEHAPGQAEGVVNRCPDGIHGPPEDCALRSKILTFYVNHAPIFVKNAAFRPTPNQVFSTRAVTLNPFASDDDPLDPTIFNKVGGTAPGAPTILRWKVAVKGKYLTPTGPDTCYVEANEFSSSNAVQLLIPPWIATGNITFRIRVCDCQQCDFTPGTRECPFQATEVSPGQGTCVQQDFPARLTAPAPGAILGDNDGTTPKPPGSGTDRDRRQP